MDLKKNESLWEEQQEGQSYNLYVTDIVVGQQGIAARARLPDNRENW